MNRHRNLQPEGVVHLCDNYSTLLLAAADARRQLDQSRTTERVDIYFIDDEIALPDSIAARLTQATGATITRVSDSKAVLEFCQLPSIVPSVVRRNLTLRRGRLKRPWHWRPHWLPRTPYREAFVYHPGFFLSKVLAGHAKRVVMRDSGYSNYVQHSVAPVKQLLRLVSGLPPRWQTWGEEGWVDAIQVVRPDRLPEPVRPKASAFRLDDVMRDVGEQAAYEIASAFAIDASIFPNVIRSRSALLLTQPLDLLGLCTTAERHLLYADLADQFTELGYDVYVKHHPRDRPSSDATWPTIPAEFPIEGWIWMRREPFDVAVSLNSAALSAEQVSFATNQLQLLEPHQFYAEHYRDWASTIRDALRDWITLQAQEARPPQEP